MKQIATLALVIVFVTGCAEREAADATEQAERLLQTDREFARASLQYGAAEAFRRYLHEDATLFSSGRNPVHGRDSIYSLMKRGDEEHILEWTPRAAEVARSGEMGWTWGEFTATPTQEDSQRIKSWGTYVNVWKKNAAGEWKVVADIGNPSPPPGER